MKNLNAFLVSRAVGIQFVSILLVVKDDGDEFT